MTGADDYLKVLSTLQRDVESRETNVRDELRRMADGAGVT